jgi:hypothetical protein
MRPPLLTTLATLAALAAAPTTSVAQRGGNGAPPSADGTSDPRSNVWHLMAQAVPVVTHAANTVGGVSLTEGYLSQVAAMVRADLLGRHLRLDATLNAEGQTMRRGELSTGAFGEGFIDRRHPHTYLHEVVATGLGALGPLRYSVSAGRGFAAFGTDDPMMRPFEKYPINHHLAQILERAMVTGAVRVGPAIVEASTFGGEEPTSPSYTPTMSRFGDSWSVRGTVLPLAGLEVQASYARVASPEHVSGIGLDQRKRSVSARFISASGDRYVLSEWARTLERDAVRNTDVFGYETALIEGATSLGPVGLALRLEQTERPEEERETDPFRVPRPASDLAIGGITRWRTATLALTFPSPTSGPIRGYPFLEVARMSTAGKDPRSLFQPSRFYGERAPWMLTAGARIRFGAPHARMGRYGVAIPAGPVIRALGGAGDDSKTVHDH